MSVTESYLETRVMTAAPAHLHLMVVDGALRFARKALACLEERDFETAHFSFNRSRQCVNELVVGLDGEQGAEMVDRLRQLFIFVHRNLTQADLLHNPQLARDAIRVLELHRETWQELVEQLPRQAPVSAPSESAFSWST